LNEAQSQQKVLDEEIKVFLLLSLFAPSYESFSSSAPNDETAANQN
jgi:hypothetical protein